MRSTTAVAFVFRPGFGIAGYELPFFISFSSSPLHHIEVIFPVSTLVEMSGINAFWIVVFVAHEHPLRYGTMGKHLH